MVSLSAHRCAPGIPDAKGLSRHSRPVLPTSSLERLRPRMPMSAASAVPSLPPWPAVALGITGCDQDDVRPEQRLLEIAAILAVAVLRLRKAAKSPAGNLPESGCDPLEVSPKTRLSVTTG